MNSTILNISKPKNPTRKPPRPNGLYLLILVFQSPMDPEWESPLKAQKEA